MTTNILVQEITPSGLSQPQAITLNGRPTCDRIQHTLREVLKSDNIFLLNQELFENISAASYNSTTFKYYRTNINYPEAGDLVCRNGAILSTKHESAGQTLDFAGKHEELGTEECDKLLNRLPQIEDAKSTSSSDAVPLPAVEKVLPSESAQQGHAKKVKTHHKTEKPLRAHHSFSDLRPGSQCLAFDFNQPVQQTEIQVKSKPDLPEGEWRWVTSTRVVYSANRFPGATEYKLSLGPIVLEDGTTERIKEEFVFSTAVVDIDSVHFEYTRSPVIMIVFNQRVKSKLNVYCVDVAMKPYAPTEDIKTLFKTASIIEAYEKAIENGMTVRFFKPERWPLNSQELTFIVDSGSHSEEGPLPSKGIKHKAYLTSTFNIRPLQWTQIPVSTNPIFQFSLPIHPECIATIKDYINVTTEVEDIVVQGDRVCIQVPQKEVEFDVTFKHSLMSTDGIILGNDFKRTYKKFRGMLCVPTGNAKVTNVATPALQMIAGSSKCEYSISSASFDQNLMPQVGTNLGGGEALLPDLNHEVRIFTIDLAQYFVAERKLLAIIVPNQGTYYVQRTDWIVDTFAHENGIEVSVYTKDLKPVNNPTIIYNNEKGQLVTVKDKMIIPANVTSFKVLAEGDWAVFSVPEVVPAHKQNIDLYTTTDRGLYQPGEKAHIVGFARDSNGAIPTGNLKYSLKDGHSNEILKGTIDIRSLSFDIEILVPKSASPGAGHIDFLYNDEVCHQMKFPIKEFRIPDNEVLISSSQDVSANTVNIDTEVKSFIGDDVAGATISGNFVVKNDTMSLPQYPEFLFYMPHDSSLVMEPLAKINGELGGSSRVKSTFGVKNSTSLVAIEYKAETRLKNGDRLEGNHVAKHRPRGFAVGLNIKKDHVVSAAFPFSFEAIVIDENDAVVDGVNVYFEVWAKIYNHISLVKEFVKQVHHGKAIPVALTPGEFFIQAYVSDTHGNVTTTRSESFSIGNDVTPKSAVVVTLDKNEYAPNEIARVHVSGLPSYFKHGLCNMYVKCNELVKVSKTLEGNGDFTIDLPLNHNLAPRASVYCSIIGFGTSVEETEIHVNIVGSTTLNIRSAQDVKFSVNVNKNLGPAEKSHVTCEFDQPLSEDVKLTVWAVDDAVLKLAKYVLEHPLEYLTKKKTQYKANTTLTVPLTSQQRGWTGIKFIYVATLTGRVIPIPWNIDMTVMDLKKELEEQIGIPRDQSRLIYFAKQLTEDGPLVEYGVLPGAKIYLVLRLRGDGGGSGTAVTQDAGTPIALRKSNGPLAWFKTVNVAKGNKSTSIEIEAPTDLKRYKVFALAIGATVASKQETVFNVTKPFSISALVLRHLCIGDSTTFPVTLYNRGEHDMTFKVAARTKSLTVSGAHGFSGTIKANSSTSVAFDLTAGEYLNGAIQVVAVGRASSEVECSDAIEYPIRVSSLSLRRGVFGRFENKNETRAHTIDINEHILGSGEININISPSVLSQGVEALTYLGDYRYMCSEQMSSQLLVALPYLMLGAFARVPDQKSPTEITTNIQNYVKALEARHMRNGRFSYWTNGTDYPTVNVQVAHALFMAKLAGFTVSIIVQYNCSEYLKQIIEGADTDTTNKAYAAYVLHLLKDGSVTQFVEKLKTIGKSAKSIIALAFLAAIPETGLIKTFVKKLGKSVESALDEDDESRGSWTYRNDIPKLCSLTILALLENKDAFKDEELLNKTMGTLLNNRKSGHWMSTHSNMWSLTALARYHEKAEKHFGEEFKVKAWLGKRYLGELSSDNTTLKLHFDTSVDLKSLPQLTLQLTGAPVWYSAQVKLDSKVAEKPPSERFTIERRIYGIERADDVTVGQKDGRAVYLVKHGAQVAVEVSVQDKNYDTIKFFAVQDPVAAGLEPIEKINTKQLYYRGSRLAWDHIDVRLDGVDAFADFFYGQKTYTYKALALRKGTYTMPSCHVEEMYNIDNFGDSETATVIIE